MAVGFGSGLIALIGLLRSTDSRAAMGLTITNLSSTNILITVTNASATNFYQIQRRLALDAQNPWLPLTNGNQGQTNFTIGKGIFLSAAYQALNCIDCDNDNSPDSQDGNSNDPFVGQLAVTIDNPADGATIP